MSVFCLLFSAFSFAADFGYDSKDKRDPFVPLVGPGALDVVKGLADIRSIEYITVNGIVYDEKKGSIAIINGTLLKEGAKVGVIVVEKIEPKKVILLIEDRRYEVPLGGKKGG